MTEEQIRALFAQLFGVAMQDFQSKTLPGLFTAALTPISDGMKGINTALEGLKPQQQTQTQQTQQTQQQTQTQQSQQTQTQQTTLSPEVNSMILDLKRSNEQLAGQVKTLNDAKTEADKKAEAAERMNVINDGLAGFQFASDAARATAVGLISSQVKRTDTGALVAGDNLTPAAFIKDFLPTQHAYLLAPTGNAGSGVTPGNTGRGPTAFDMDKIGPTMSKEDEAAAVVAIQQAMTPKW